MIAAGFDIVSSKRFHLVNVMLYDAETMSLIYARMVEGAFMYRFLLILLY